LESVGFGATRPVAPNDTSENMAKNRRIEFTVRPQ
jgi:OmpA-OmpF porin, OOP family